MRTAWPAIFHAGAPAAFRRAAAIACRALEIWRFAADFGRQPRLAALAQARYDQGIEGRIREALSMHDSKWVTLLLGLAIGLVVGLNVAGLWPQVPLHAVATHGQDNFAICTAPMDEDVEAVFVLDDLTGDLKGAALNVQMRRLYTGFEYNVLQDLPTPNTKNPHYRIVSGMANIRQNFQAGPLARSVLYVAEVSSGQLVVYGIPWIAGRAQAAMPVKTTLILLDRWQYRTTPVRNQ
jgi:hypothetical protein